MALTLVVEQRLERVGLVKFFGESESLWEGLAQEAYDFTRRNFPDGAIIRPDDLVPMLASVLKVHKKLTDFLNGKPLREKYWVTDFCDLVLDRTWNKITQNKPKPGG